MSDKIDVLDVMDELVITKRFALSAAIGRHAASVAQLELDRAEQAMVAVAELIEVAARVADEHMGIVADTKYTHEEDEVGDRVCCGVVSYKPHADDCDAVKLRAALANIRGNKET